MRISDDRTGDALGVERQEADCRALAERRGWSVGKVYRENDTSAFKRRKVRLPDGTTALRVLRPAFRELLADLADGSVSALVAYDLDRVARDPRDLEDLIDAVEQRNVPTATVTGDVDLSSDNGIFMARMMVNVANKSSRDTSRRVRRAMLANAEAGKLHGGSRPFGYLADRLTAHPEESAHVLWAYEQALAGASLRSIALGLAERAPGRRWDNEAAKRMLTAPRYAGLRQHQGRVVGTAAWEPLVERPVWETVRALLASREHPARAVGGPRKYLLTGLLTCGTCGGRLYPRRNADRQRFGCLPTPAGGCGGSLVVYEPAEQAVVGLVLDRLRSDVDLTPVADDPTLELRAALDRVERQQIALGEAFADEPDDLLAFRAASASLHKKADALRNQLGEVQQSRRVEDPASVAVLWPTYDQQQQRGIVDVLVERIVVGPARGGPRFDPARLNIVWR